MIECGVYIHIPFCEKRCNYCNFFSSIYQKDVVERYVKELTREIRSVGSKDINVKTIYFGGGTPSLLSEQQLFSIMDALYDAFTVRGEEITIEVNPNSSDKLAFYKSCGINRVSIGIQSTDDIFLKKMGRLHTAEEGLASLENARRYFDNVSADIILGVDKRQDAGKEFYALKDYVTHLSAYMLTLEEGTPLYRSVCAKNVAIATEDEVISQYNTFVSVAEANGFIRYETSNFAKNGMTSKHNSSYWDLTPYIGIGAGAHSYYNGKRYYNEPNIKEYIAGKHAGDHREMIERGVSKEEDKYEYIMLALRMVQGVDRKRYNTLFGTDFAMEYADLIKKMGKYLRVTDTNVNISPEYFLVQNEIIRSILD